MNSSCQICSQISWLLLLSVAARQQRLEMILIHWAALVLPWAITEAYSFYYNHLLILATPVWVTLRDSPGLVIPTTVFNCVAACSGIFKDVILNDNLSAMHERSDQETSAHKVIVFSHQCLVYHASMAAIQPRRLPTDLQMPHNSPWEALKCLHMLEDQFWHSLRGSRWLNLHSRIGFCTICFCLVSVFTASARCAAICFY